MPRISLSPFEFFCLSAGTSINTQNFCSKRLQFPITNQVSEISVTRYGRHITNLTDPLDNKRERDFKRLFIECHCLPKSDERRMNLEIIEPFLDKEQAEDKA